tara:strand:+ start:1496 stop:1969 length:474 start_codon:yes stop_codon:yes gene_type:complete
VNTYLDTSEIPGIDDDNGEITLEPFELVEIKSDISKREDDIATDYAKVRANMDYQQQMLMEAAKIALENARNGEHPKQMEVFATLMDKMTNLNTKIISVHKEIADIAKPIAQPDPNSGALITAENVFIGSTAELMEKVGSQQDQEDREKEINPNVNS